VSREQYYRLAAEQNSVCAICRMPESQTGILGDTKKLSVDHCHACGDTRGLLCGKCNLALGLGRDDPQTFILAADYLRKHRRAPRIHNIPRPRSAEPVGATDDSHMAPRTALILKLRGEGATFKAIGQRLGLTRQRVTQLWERTQEAKPLYQICWCGAVIPQTARAGQPRKYCTLEHTLRSDGLTHGEYRSMRDAQCNLCAICKSPETVVTPSGKVRKLGADRCPQTGAVRDLLCNSCDKLLGFMNENVEILRTAAVYLERHRELILERPQSGR